MANQVAAEPTRELEPEPTHHAKRPSRMKIPRASDQSKAFFRSTLPNDPRITVRQMFGNESAFVNGNMFYGLFGDNLFVRLPEAEGQEILNMGGSPWKPMKGRPMKEYVILPKAWWKQPHTIRKWITKSIDWTAKMPEKKKPKK